MTLTPGATLGPYTIRAEIGYGGMGVVYTAHDPRLDRQVAIKVLPPDLTRDDIAKQRFLQEAKAASALDHPNICTIHEINETPDGQLYLVMAYYEGETLKERIERGALALDEAEPTVSAGATARTTGSGLGVRRRVTCSRVRAANMGAPVDHKSDVTHQSMEETDDRYEDVALRCRAGRSRDRAVVVADADDDGGGTGRG